MKKIKQPHGGAIVQAEKGETANPNGRPKKSIAIINSELIASGHQPAKMSEIKDCYLLLINLTEQEIKECTEKAETPMLMKVVGKSILSKSGFDVIEKLLDRSLGKPTQGVDVTSKGKRLRGTQINLSSVPDEVLDELMKYAQDEKETED